MTLVPIIYTSLLILSAFLFFVVIVSYISYKAKSRDRVPAHLKHLNPLDRQLAIQPIATNNFSSAQAQIKTEHYIHSKIQTLNQIKVERGDDNYIKAVETMKRRGEENNRYQEDNVKEMRSIINRKENRPTKRIENLQQPVSNRLEIMNHSDKFKTQVKDFEYQNKSNIRYSNHGDVNLFTFYSDRSDLDFVALSTPQINRAI